MAPAAKDKIHGIAGVTDPAASTVMRRFHTGWRFIAFGAALPVGVGGTHELADLQMTRYVPVDEALEALQRASVPDLMVKACDYIEPHAPAASAAYPIAVYRALLSHPPATFPVPDEVTVVRKKKEKVLCTADFLVGELELSGAVATFSLESKPTGSLRPDVLLRACCEAADAVAPEASAPFPALRRLLDET